MTLTQYIASIGTTPFDWPTANCCHFSAKWVELVMGRNPMADLPATPDMKSARRLIKALGGSLEAAWTQRLGYGPLATPNLAQLGDVVLLPLGEDGREAVGICVGSVAAFITDHGDVAFVPISAVTHAWRIEPCHG